MALKTAWLFFGTIIIGLQLFFHVSCVDVGDFYMNVNDSDTSGSLSIECSRTIEVAKDFLCRFQLSNGTLITYKSVISHKEENVTEPVKYGIIHPSSNASKKVCKIKVYPPFYELESRKTWKCWIITVNQTFGTLVEYQLKKRSSSAAKIGSPPAITSHAVHVKRGDDFMIGCQVMEPIAGCTFYSPNGHNFTVLNDAKRTITRGEYGSKDGNYIKLKNPTRYPIRALVYNSSFSMGDCFAIVSRASTFHHDKIHAGQWTCKLKLNNTGKIVAGNFTVDVKDSYLVANSTEVNSLKGISCTAIPGLSSKIVECYWEVFDNNFPNISLSKNNTSCNLTFKDSKTSHKGKLTCNATFENDFGDKYNDIVSMTYLLSTSPIKKPLQLEIEYEDESEEEEDEEKKKDKKKKKDEKDKKKKEEKEEKDEKDKKKKNEKDKKEKDEKDKKDKDNKKNPKKNSKSASALSSSPTWLITGLLSIISVLHYLNTSR